MRPLKRSAAEPHLMTVISEPGHEEMWASICRLSRSDCFTVDDLMADARVSHGTALAYLGRLVRNGLAVKRASGRKGVFVYQASKCSNWPPVFDGQGRLSNDHAMRAALWRSAKMIKVFSVRDLQVAATSDSLQINAGQAQRFIERLEGSGYLRREAAPNAAGEQMWRFLSHMNTGALPPRFCNANLVFDVNQRRFMNEHAVVAEVRL